MNIKEQLLQGKPFSGRNGAFTGRAQSIEGDTLIVICDKDGTRWHASCCYNCLRNTYLH